MTLLNRRNTWATLQQLDMPTLNDEFNNIINVWNMHDQALSKWQKASISGTLNVDGTTTFNTATYTWPSALPGAASILQTATNGTLSWVTASTAYGPLGSAYVTIGNDATLTAERALTGTANQITVTDNGAGSTVVLSTPQNIHTGASPTFVGGTFTGTLDGQGQLKGKGTATNDNAAAGYIGEIVTSSQTTSTNFPATTVWGDGATISLTAGDWDISGVLSCTANAATFTRFQMGISSTSGNSTTGLVQGDTQLDVELPVNGVRAAGMSIPAVRASLSGTTSYYLKVESEFSAGTPQYTCRISARRVR